MALATLVQNGSLVEGSTEAMRAASSAGSVYVEQGL